MANDCGNKGIVNPADISLARKRRFLLELTEDQFRDKAVRPLFLRKGLRHGREVCGPDEEGKDCYFLDENKLGMRELYVVQTKRGKLNMTRKTSENVHEAATQLRTALATTVPIAPTKERLSPNYAILCASGEINSTAREWICSQIDDPRVRFMDAQDLIPEIDRYYPEFWYGIDAEKFPYLKGLKEHLLKSSDTITLAELDIDGSTGSPITDEMYVPLYLYKVTAQIVKRSGRYVREPKFDQVPVHALLARKERLIHLVGGAGAGKTTALRRFAYCIAEKSLQAEGPLDIPVLVRASDVARSGDRLVDLAAVSAAQHSPNASVCFSTEDLADGRVVLLIDALDEVGSADRASVVARISEFHKEYPECRVILTSRDYSGITGRADLNAFSRFQLSPINFNQAEKILQHLYRKKSVQSEGISEVLRQLQQVHGIELNPLLVTIFAATSDVARRDIPPNITELFKKFTELMLGRWDQRKGVSQQYQSVVKDFLLQQLAFNMHSRHLTRLPLEECRAICSDLIRDTDIHADFDTLFDEIVTRSGLVCVEADEVRFRHVLLQEFFAGRSVQSADFFRSVLFDEWWRKPVIFYFGDHPAAHGDLTKLVDVARSYTGPQLYHGAITIGLAAQACYLSRTAEKEQSLQWVIEALAESKEGYIEAADRQRPGFPMTSFLNYYMYARDAVAASAIVKSAKSFIDTALSKVTLEKKEEIETFWYIVSLIESGRLDLAEEVVKHFKPSDARLLLALHLGCFLIQHLKVSSTNDKKTAERICNRVAPLIAHLRDAVLREVSSMLIEVRSGKLTALPVPEADQSDPDGE